MLSNLFEYVFIHAEFLHIPVKYKYKTKIVTFKVVTIVNKINVYFEDFGRNSNLAQI